MLTLQKCRSLLGTDCKLTDAELEQLRQELYALSAVAVGAFCAQKRPFADGGLKSQIVSGCLNEIPEPERVEAEERAAILEFECDLKKPEAERQAFGEWVRSKKEHFSNAQKRSRTGTPRKRKTH